MEIDAISVENKEHSMSIASQVQENIKGCLCFLEGDLVLLGSFPKL